MCTFVRGNNGNEQKASDCGNCNCAASSATHSRTQVDVSVLTDNEGNVLSVVPIYECSGCHTHM